VGDRDMCPDCHEEWNKARQKSREEKMRKEIYISTDIETDGPIPGPNSMLSIGSAAYVNYQLVDTFSANLELLPGAEPDIKTKEEFWDKNPEAWAACRKDLQDPAEAMNKYVTWVKDLERKHKAKAVFVAYPAGFDWTFVYWYMMRFGGYSPFSFSALDMKTLAMSMIKKGYRGATKRNMPKKWFSPDKKHNHIAVDDAVEQGELFCNMMKQLLKIKE
jgi:DNA polymerase III alpha subunit (gram-positive type)